MSASRRQFLAGSGAGLLSFCVGGCERLMTPREAREQGVTLRVLTDAEGASLAALGDILVPGSAEAGLVHFVDHQLAAPPDEQMLMLKYLGVSPPLAPFYQGSLAALDGAAGAAYGAPFARLAENDAQALVAAMAAGAVEGWDGPPAGFAYFVLRNDAVDVVYGTPEGFARLGVPYMAHIDPPSRWGE